MLSKITYLQIYASMFSASLLFFFPGIFSYKTFVTIVGAISITVLLYNFMFMRFGKKYMFFAFVAMALLAWAYYATQYFFNYPAELYPSYLLLIMGQLTPVVLTGVVVAYDKKTQVDMQRLAPVISILFTVISMFAAFFPTSTTSGGFANNDNGLNYQSSSYMAAYAASFNVYFLLVKDKKMMLPVFNRRIVRLFMPALLGLNLLTILVAGGRGGLVLFIVQSLIGLFYYGKLNKGRHNKLRMAIVIAICAYSARYAISIASSLSLDTSGLVRISQTISEGDFSDRGDLRVFAIRSFMEKPYFGHGVGSVFYILDIYSHNCFVDALVEIGAVGCFFYALLLFTSVRKAILLIREDSNELLWLFIFLDGFMLSLFSGYYLAHLPMFWVISFVLSRRKDLQEDLYIDTNFAGIRRKDI